MRTGEWGGVRGCGGGRDGASSFGAPRADRALPAGADIPEQAGDPAVSAGTGAMREGDSVLGILPALRALLTLGTAPRGGGAGSAALGGPFS